MYGSKALVVVPVLSSVLFLALTGSWDTVRFLSAHALVLKIHEEEHCFYAENGRYATLEEIASSLRGLYAGISRSPQPVAFEATSTN